LYWRRLSGRFRDCFACPTTFLPPASGNDDKFSSMFSFGNSMRAVYRFLPSFPSGGHPPPPSLRNGKMNKVYSPPAGTKTPAISFPLPFLFSCELAARSAPVTPRFTLQRGGGRELLSPPSRKVHKRLDVFSFLHLFRVSTVTLVTSLPVAPQIGTTFSFRCQLFSFLS